MRQLYPPFRSTTVLFSTSLRANFFSVVKGQRCVKGIRYLEVVWEIFLDLHLLYTLDHLYLDHPPTIWAVYVLEGSVGSLSVAYGTGKLSPGLDP